MTDSENLLKAFHSFANLFEPIWFWKMDSAFHVLQSDCPHESLFRSLLLREGRREAIEAHIATTDRPVCFTVPSMLSWIIGFAPEGGKIHNIYLVGPFFLDYKDPESSADRMAQTDLTQEAQAALQALGYTSAEAARAINLVRDQADTVDALIMLALRQIGSL